MKAATVVERRLRSRPAESVRPDNLGELWRLPPRNPVLGSQDVDVWLIDLGVGVRRVEEFASLLSEDEKDRAARFLAGKDRERFMVARGLLRIIIADYLGALPGDLRFSYGAFGKPGLEAGWGSALEFNLAHSEGLALLAVTRGRRVGVDLEFIRADVDNEQIAERFFSPGEVAVLDGLPTGLRNETFFRVWTRKEAYVKARGEGLSIPLDQFCVAPGPGNEQTPVGDGTPLWFVTDLAADPAYAAAVAVEGSDWRLRCFRFSE
jgi:4'-phosphopantetheinyl transferase